MLRICLLILTLLSSHFVWAESMQPSLEKVEVNCMIKCEKQTIYITGTNPKNPVLLVIHGGPGFAMLPLFHKEYPSWKTSSQ